MHKLTFASLLLLSVSAEHGFAQSRIRVPQDAGSVQSAITMAQDGDTVVVSPGTYRETINFQGKSITVTSGAKNYSEASGTVLQGDGRSPVVTIQGNASTHSELNGFTIEGGNSSDPAMCGGVTISGAAPTLSNNVVTSNQACGVAITNGASPLVKGNDIIANGGSGVVVNTAGDVTLLANVIESNVISTSIFYANNFGAGLLVRTGNTDTSVAANSLILDHNVIRNNVADENSAFEQQIGSAIKNLTLVNNLFYGNIQRAGADYTQVYLSGPYPTPGQNIRTGLTEINNTIVGGGEFLVLFFSSSVIANNVFYNTVPRPATYSSPDFSGLACAAQDETALVDIRNNDIYNVGPQMDGRCRLGANNLAVEPQLRDIANGDLHEQLSSPLVGAGDITAPLIPAADLDNKARSVCGAIDIGAYELRSHPPIALTSSANPTPGGGNITFTAKLTGNCNVPVGIVTVLDGSTVIGTGTLDTAGIAAFTTSFLVVGNHNITATYPGDFNFEDGTSPVLVQVITGDPTATSLTVTPNPTGAFSTITLSSAVTSQYGTPTGSVEFRAGNQVLATAALDGNGRVSATISSLGAGTYSIAANYTADTRFQPSTSPPVQELVVGAQSATAFTASPNPSYAGQPLLLTATVHASQNSRLPTGSVTFQDGTTVLGSATLNNGVAIFSTSALGLGTHVLAARYTGSPDFGPSSATVTEIVSLIGTSLSLGTSPNPSNTGQTVTLSATLASSVAGPLPIGTITFRDGVNVIGTASPDASGVATFTTSALALGVHPLQAVFAGDSSHAPAFSSIVNQNVLAYDFIVSVSNNMPTIPSGDWMRMIVTVSPVGGFTGTVALSCSNLPVHANCSFDKGNTISLSMGAQHVPIVIDTSDVSRYGNSVSALEGERRTVLALAFGLPAIGLLVVGRKRRGPRLLLALCLPALLLGLQACTGRLPASTAPGTYSSSVIGRAEATTALTHSATIVLNVTRKR